MKKSTIWLWLIVILVVLFLLWIVTQVTDDAKVKGYKDHFRDEAEELKRKIYSQENVVNGIKTELNGFRTFQGYLIKKAKRICLGVRCVAGILIMGTVFIIHGMLNFSIVEVVGTITTMGGFMYLIVSGVIWNEVKGVNEVLKLFYDTVLRMTYNNHQFEPALIEALEARLAVELRALDDMKDRYKAISHRGFNNQF